MASKRQGLVAALSAVLAAALATALLSGCGTTPGSALPISGPAVVSSYATGAPSASSPGTVPHPTAGGGPAPPTTGTAPPSRRRGKRLSLTGTVEAGVERGCLVLTDEKTGLRVVLTGGRDSVVRAGARITVVGHVRNDLMSFCQQGPLFQVMMATAR